MDEVMKKAEELAQAILASDLYNRMRDLEEEVQADPEVLRDPRLPGLPSD